MLTVPAISSATVVKAWAMKIQGLKRCYLYQVILVLSMITRCELFKRSIQEK